MAFGDVFAGWMDAAHEHQKNLLQMEYQNKKQLAEQYAKLADDPRYDETSQKEFMRRAMEIPTLEAGKKMPKEYQNFTIQVQPPTLPPVNLPEQKAGSPESQIPGVPSPAEATIPAQTIQAPTPPPHELMAQMPFEEQMDRLKQQSLAKGASSQNIASFKASIPQKVGRDVVQGPDGRRYPLYTYQRFNPETGQMEKYQEQGDIPLGFFAPRPGAKETASNLLRMVGEDVLEPPLDVNGKPLNIQTLSQMNPNQILQHIGENRYVPVLESKAIRSINNQMVPVGQDTGTVAGPSLGTARPDTTTTSWRDVGVDPQGRRIYEPFDVVRRVATGPRTTALPLGATVAPSAPPAAPEGQGTAPMPPPGVSSLQQPTPPRTTPQRVGAITPGAQRFNQQTLQSVRPAAQILYGDSRNPDFESLQDFATIADDPRRRDLVGQAAKTIIQKMGRTGTMDPEVGLRAFGASANTGGILKVLTNYLGLPGAQAASETKVVEDSLKQLTPKEIRMLGRIMAAYGTIVGLRRITSGGAYQFSTEAMEREVPIPGMTGVNSSQSYYNKLAQLGEELTAGTREIPREMVPEYPFWERNTAYLNAKGRGWPINKNKAGDYAFQHEDGQWYDQHGQLIR